MKDETATLGAMLDAIHAALRRGDFAALPALTAAFEAHVPDGLPRDSAALAALRRKLQRNDACLQASARGLRAARRRLTEIRAARAGLQTYTQSGTRERIGGPSGTLAQRF